MCGKRQKEDGAAVGEDMYLQGGGVKVCTGATQLRGALNSWAGSSFHHVTFSCSHKLKKKGQSSKELGE